MATKVCLGAASLLLLVLLCAWLFSNFERAHHGGPLTSCGSNMNQIATALETYATDNQGNYPHGLSDVRSRYLKTIPTCPEAHADTYSESYHAAPDFKAYTFYCSGANHAAVDLPPNFPQYTSKRGLVLTK